MDFKFSADEIEFRKYIRTVLEEGMLECSGAAQGDIDDASDGLESGDSWSPEFSRFLGSRGLISLPWPVQYGGSGLNHMKQMIFNEEVGDLNAPIGAHRRGLFYAAPILMIYGTEQQKKEYLPRIAAGEAFFCQGFSEPGAGSDLASLQTKAIRQGDNYIVNGSKIWTSDGHRAEYMFLAARTDLDAAKHRGISNFLVDMKYPGVTVSPIVNMAGIHSFNQIFFDNVSIPANMLVGDEGKGWYQTAAALDFERSSITSFAAVARTVKRYVAHLRQERTVPPSPVRHELAALAIDVEVGRLMAYRIASMQSQGKIPNLEASMSKLFSSELSQRAANVGMKLFGMRSNVIEGPDAQQFGFKVGRSYLSSPSATIGGGTSEVQRNVIATRGLGLPR